MTFRKRVSIGSNWNLKLRTGCYGRRCVKL